MTATRLYQFRYNDAAVVPILNAAWDVSATSAFLLTPDRASNNANNASTSQANGNLSEAGTITIPQNQTAIQRICVSYPLSANTTISGTVAAQLLCRSITVSAQVKAQLEIYVVNSTGTVIRGVLLVKGDYSGGTNLIVSSSGRRNKIFAAAGTAVNTVKAKKGDRIVVIWGYTQTTQSSSQAVARFGCPRQSGQYYDTLLALNLAVPADLPQDETTTEGVGWVEFSATIPFDRIIPHGLSAPAGTSVTSITTGSQTPTANAAQLLVAQQRFTATPNIPVITTTTNLPTFNQYLTFTQLQGPGPTAMRTTIWYCQAPAVPTGGTITLTTAGQTQVDFVAHWWEFTNLDTTQGTFGILQNITGGQSSPNTADLTLTLGSAISSVENNVIGFWLDSGSTQGGSDNPDTNWEWLNQTGQTAAIAHPASWHVGNSKTSEHYHFTAAGSVMGVLLELATLMTAASAAQNPVLESRLLGQHINNRSGYGPNIIPHIRRPRNRSN